MSRYKKIMTDKGLMQKDLLDGIRLADKSIDKPLLSKIVNNIVLPTPFTLSQICKTLGCEVLDIYERKEVDICPPAPEKAVNKSTAQTRKRRAQGDFYNLTVEVPRELANKVLCADALRKLGYLSKTDLVNHLLIAEYKRLCEIREKETADPANAGNGGNDKEK